MKKLSKDFIGTSLSYGTLRAADLIQSFMYFLHKHWKEKYNEIITNYPNTPFNDFELLEQWIDKNQDEASWLLHEELFEALNEIAPKGTYFGAHPGDGSDFGFWSD